MVQLEAKVPESKIALGLEDGGHVYVDCSACGAILMDNWVTDPNQDFLWKVRANCPFCGDKSYITEIKGLFHRGGYGKMREDSDCDDIESTVVDDVFQDDDGVCNFVIRKANESAKPCYRR